MSGVPKWADQNLKLSDENWKWASRRKLTYNIKNKYVTITTSNSEHKKEHQFQYHYSRVMTNINRRKGYPVLISCVFFMSIKFIMDERKMLPRLRNTSNSYHGIALAVVILLVGQQHQQQTPLTGVLWKMNLYQGQLINTSIIFLTRAKFFCHAGVISMKRDSLITAELIWDSPGKWEWMIYHLGSEHW